MFYHVHWLPCLIIYILEDIMAVIDPLNELPFGLAGTAFAMSVSFLIVNCWMQSQ